MSPLFRRSTQLPNLHRYKRRQTTEIRPCTPLRLCGRWSIALRLKLEGTMAGMLPYSRHPLPSFQQAHQEDLVPRASRREVPPPHRCPPPEPHPTLPGVSGSPSSPSAPSTSAPSPLSSPVSPATTPAAATAGADESIPAADRGRWATYPVLALQGWAQQHETALRQVIATESQFQGFDPGAAKVILQPDDIPANGHMAGRSRLEVIAPDTAAKLAAIGDGGLIELLPAAPTDVNPPADETFNKWFEVIKPMMSPASDRGGAHLRAFVDYADHAQEKALFVAHTAVDASVQRVAITDWVYWQHLSVLTSDALAGLQTA